MKMKKLMTIDYSVDVASGTYAIANIQQILGIILLILSISSIIIKGVMTIYIHIKNKNYNEVLKTLEKTSEELEQKSEELAKLKDGDLNGK